jgi:hypothetical protein
VSSAEPAAAVQALGRLVRLDPREVWPHEANDFTPWLLENGDVLADALELEIELTDREHEVGDYFLDLVGVDITNDCPLVVENQLTRTDHSHLGQLLTYAAGTDARTVVWVAPGFREEHRQAIDFLNTLTEGTARFFAVEVSVVRIGDSAPAPLLRLVVKPNDWHAAASASARNAGSSSLRGRLYLSLWGKVVEALNVTTPGEARSQKLVSRSWLTVSRPASVADSNCAFARNDRAKVELYIGRGSADENQDLFDRLLLDRDAIESEVGAELSWEELDGKRACRIALYRDGDVEREDMHAEYAAWLSDAVQRFKRVFTPDRLSAPDA